MPKETIVGLQEALEKKKLKKRIIREGIKPELSYTFELFTIDKDSLSKLVFTDNRRRISKKQKAGLKKLLLNGKHFDSHIVVNEVEKEFWISKYGDDI